ncbi:glutamate receptor-interacting protein 1 isoform X1 [Copidosoma floridanum]|uniref:glutamate receptor-interacting protein 1 isoform X1 n=1 Tax=Copidosoma floridanum TaxID=29053 RepID=UPI0006C97C87|nr:glutamate receptor-interacting protein 1 isoform X1 [Copidosoma floridanum]
MAKMFSSLRLATMRSHKKTRPGSVATNASSDSAARTDEAPSTAPTATSAPSPCPGQMLPGSFYSASPFLEDVAETATTSLSSKVAQVRVERESGSLGVTLRGSAGRALVVTSVKPEGPAAREGRVRPGDRLLAVDDAELRGLTLAEAQRALRRSSDSPIASLTIEYDVANMDEIRAATSGPLLVQLERGPQGELGLTVRDAHSGVYIESLRPASTADRCGALQPGDRLLGVDDVVVQDAVTAAKLLRNNSENCRIARLQILPRPPSASSRTMKRRVQPQKSTLHVSETLNVLLRPDHRGLGIGLRQSDDRLDYVVDILEPGGPAERSGVLLPGDRVVAINRRAVRDLQPAEVAMILEAPQVELMVEYKVGGAVVPSSGVFTVRVARPLGGQPDLGLTVNEGLRISEVRRGSLAYRTGSLAPGDRLLAIDNQKLDPGDLHQAAQLLHRPGSSVVALTVRKPDLTPDTRRFSLSHREQSIAGDSVQYTSAGSSSSAVRSARESLPSVDSAVDSWGEMGDVAGPEIMRLWETASVDSGQLDLPMPPYPYPNSAASNSPRPGCSCSPTQPLPPPPVSPSQQQILHVSLHKDPVYEDFGFSVSDGLYERGVYINRLRPGGPCDGLLRPFDRILRVNEASTEECDCCLAVPLIAAAGARLELTIARPVSPTDSVNKLY